LAAAAALSARTNAAWSWRRARNTRRIRGSINAPGLPANPARSSSLGQPSGAIAVLKGLPQNGYLAALSDDGPIDLPARAHETVQLRRRKPARLCIQHRKRRAAHVELVGKPRRYGGAAATPPSAVADAQREVLV
jgi:hypothetical protein